MHLQMWKWFDDKSVKITAFYQDLKHQNSRDILVVIVEGSTIPVRAVKKYHYFHF